MNETPVQKRCTSVMKHHDPPEESASPAQSLGLSELVDPGSLPLYMIRKKKRKLKDDKEKGTSTYKRKQREIESKEGTYLAVCSQPLGQWMVVSGGLFWKLERPLKKQQWCIHHKLTFYYLLL